MEDPTDRSTFDGAEPPNVREAVRERRLVDREGEAHPASIMGWRTLLVLLLWGVLVLAFAAGGLADVTNLWWLVLVFGAAAPVVLVVLRSRVLGELEGRYLARARSGERELLDALREHDGLTPAMAAMLTTLTVDEAAGLLEGLARKGHLEARARDGTLVYALREQDRRELEKPLAERVAAPDDDSISEPLSERELEVLRLVASGKTNAEVARELFVAVGTVKAHANNIYRKLDASNRAEAISKARNLGLLR